MPQARADDDGAQSAIEHLGCSAQHQFGVERIDGDPRRQHADQHASGAQFQGRARGEQGRAGHAGGATDDRDAAVGALVGVARARGEHRGECGAIEQLSAVGSGHGRGAQVEIGHRHRAGKIAAVVRVKAWLVGDKGHGAGRPDRATSHATGIGVEAGRHIERQDRRRGVAHLRDPVRVGCGDRAREADAEEAIDDQVETERCGHGGQARATGGAPFFRRRFRIRG